MWLKREPTLFPLLKMPDIRTNTACWLVSVFPKMITFSLSQKQKNPKNNTQSFYNKNTPIYVKYKIKYIIQPFGLSVSAVPNISSRAQR